MRDLPLRPTYGWIKRPTRLIIAGPRDRLGILMFVFEMREKLGCALVNRSEAETRAPGADLGDQIKDAARGTGLRRPLVKRAGTS